ncbi:MAG: glycoside hydrolase family 97 N-terminal domain-containing protein, partial [Prevotella sp.]|nr:glycoside hydrolase family 97 N-terminal domain-containing protein [Prevotella sp.]
MNRIYLSLAFVLLPLLATAQSVSSPNGNIVVKFSLDNGRPQYEMSYKGKQVICPSHLGL